jgi:hypothetical protein
LGKRGTARGGDYRDDEGDPLDPAGLGHVVPPQGRSAPRRDGRIRAEHERPGDHGDDCYPAARFILLRSAVKRGSSRTGSRNQ